MFEIGDLIVYGNEGVCRVEEIGCLDIPSLSQGRAYYTLAPLYRSGKTYTPVDTTIFMRPVISFEEAQELIQNIPEIQPDVFEDTSSRELADKYKEFIRTRDCSDLVRLIKTVYAKKMSIAEKKKKLGTVDEQYMQKAEDLLYGELAVALSIPKDDIKGYIENCINSMEETELTLESTPCINL